MASAAPPDEYLRRVSGVVSEHLGDTLLAVWVGGSIAQADFHPHMSDVDVALVLGSAPPHEAIAAATSALDHRRLPCPARGLDLLGLSLETVRAPTRAPRSHFVFVTGATWTTALTGSESSPDLLIELRVYREYGVCLFGMEPQAAIPVIDDDVLTPLMLRDLDWHREHIHDPFHDPTGAFAVLNACRTWRFVAERAMGSKTEGGRWVLARRPELAVIEDALAQRWGDRSGRLERDRVLALLDLVAAEATR